MTRMLNWLFGIIEPKRFDSISIREAIICEDCGQITASKHSTCKICGSRAIWALSTVLQQSYIATAVERILKQ